MTDIKKFAKKYRKTERKAVELKNKIIDMLPEMVGKKVRLSKECKRWYSKHGEEVGLSFDELKFINKRPYGVIENVEYCRHDGFTFKIKFQSNVRSSMLVGLDFIS